jgi:hypothetical protein
MRGIVSFDIRKNRTDLLGISEHTLVIRQFVPRS